MTTNRAPMPRPSESPPDAPTRELAAMLDVMLADATVAELEAQPELFVAMVEARARVAPKNRAA